MATKHPPRHFGKSDMNRELIFALALITAYMVWLIVFVLVIEPRLRQLTELLFGVTITRELYQRSGPSSNINLLDVLDTYRWQVDEPASLPTRFGVGLLRIFFWLLAVTLPLALAICAFFLLRH